jgi:hypothetical protein
LQDKQSIKPTRLNLDASPKYLMANESYYLLNYDINNPNAVDKATPLGSNYLACEMELPAGENYAPGGGYYSALTDETYSWHYNSNGVHHIQRINSDGICEVVYNGNCLFLDAAPRHDITQWRAILIKNDLCTKVPGGTLKQLIWVDGSDNPIGMLDVEASIATDSFTTPFFDICADDCAPLQMCVPNPQGCLTGEFIPTSIEDRGKANKLLDKGFKFMFRFVYYDRRASIWSDRSSLYYQDAKGCFDNSESFSRCLKFNIPIGNPLVEKIEFAFSEDGGLTWFLSDTIEKYKPYNDSSQYWYERQLTEDISTTFDEEDCTFEYIFCNDKQRNPIDPLEVSRLTDKSPRGAQGLVPIKNSVGFYNYEKGSCPIDKTEADKFTIGITCDEEITDCDTDFATVTVRAIIHNEYFDMNGLIYRLTGAENAEDDKTDPAWFGGIIGDPVLQTGIAFQGYDQTFTGEVRNFIPYVEGTNYYGEMEQWHSAPGFTNTKKVGVVSGFDKTKVAFHKWNDIDNGNFYYQEYKFKVPKGTKGFMRLAGHHQENGLSDNQNTSTQVMGVIDNIKTYNPNGGLTLDQNKKEIYFDACNGDVDLFETFIVSDFLVISGIGAGNQSSAYSGYITDKNNHPVEGARIYRTTTYECTTDHNGYYAFYKFDGTSSAVDFDIYVEQSCVGDFTKIESFSSGSGEGLMAHLDYQIISEAYRDNFYANVKVKITDCDSQPVGGVRVAMSGNKYKVTDTEGFANFKLRNYQTRSRQAKGIVMDRGNCFILDCNNECNPCMPSTNLIPLGTCFDHTPTYILTPILLINTSSLTSGRKGLKAGGRYPFGWVLEGDCGRLSAVNETTYIDVPKTQNKGSLAFCSLSYNGNDITLPSWGKRLKIVRGINLNNYDLQWIVDKIDRTSDGKIKLTIQSLNDYNTQYNFKTNTVYKYLPGDRVEFIRNGDGQIFDFDANGILNYLTLSPFNDEVISGVTDDANYFNQLLISDDGKLDGLIEGAMIEIQTPSIATTETTYFEICASIPVIDGKLQVDAGTFNTFDTFLVSRQIDKFPAQLFESKTPSDFWGGTNLDDTGKVHFINKYENEKRYGRNITINSEGQFNYFGDFEKTLDAKSQGDIIAMALKGDKIGLALCENAPFLFQVSDDLVRLGSDNVIHAVPADNVISNPEINLRGDYGCSYEDIGSILFGDGYATYISAKQNGYIIHDYQSAKKAGTRMSNAGELITTCNSFFTKRIRQKETLNKNATNVLDHLRYSTIVNKDTGIVYLTLKSLRHPAVNNEKEAYAAPNDTIMYNPVNDNFTGFASFTLEGYAQANLKSEGGCSFIGYQNSLPYIFPSIPESYNEFCGLACDMVIGVTLNKSPDKIKIPVSMEIQSDKMFFASKVSTEMSQFISEIPPKRFKQDQDGKWNAAFLNNVNSRGGLYSGTKPISYFVKATLVRDNTLDLVYGSIDNAKRIGYSELDTILIKFSVSEQSGFQNNL